jgi:hypothetical protein
MGDKVRIKIEQLAVAGWSGVFDTIFFLTSAYFRFKERKGVVIKKFKAPVKKDAFLEKFAKKQQQQQQQNAAVPPSTTSTATLS